jgi:nuclear GTP-binding protein
VEHKILKKLYGIPDWEGADDFLEKIARRMGKLKKGNTPDVNASAKIVLQDW